MRVFDSYASYWKLLDITSNFHAFTKNFIKTFHNPFWPRRSKPGQTLTLSSNIFSFSKNSLSSLKEVQNDSVCQNMIGICVTCISYRVIMYHLKEVTAHSTPEILIGALNPCKTLKKNTKKSIFCYESCGINLRWEKN